MSNPVKVLFTGDIRGDLPRLLKKLDAVNNKSGPFAAAFVAGSFLNDQGQMQDLPLKSNTPLPIYFIGAGAGGKLPVGLTDRGLQYLGKCGVVTVAGLTVAFLDGYGESSHAASVGSYKYTRDDVELLKRKLDLHAGEVDILLTCEWPRGIAGGLEATGSAAAPPEGVSVGTGSPVVAEVAIHARPRYHIAAGQDVAFTRLPYTNRDLGVGIRATRFVGLAPIAGKAKSFHALNLTPSSDMDPEALSAKPEASTPSPLEIAAVQSNKRIGYENGVEGVNSGDWRWQQQQGKRLRIQHVAIESRPDVQKDSAATVIARNVPFGAEETELRSWFSSAAGTIVNMYRGTNAESGRLNSWMSVQYASAAEAAQAIQALNGAELQGRQISVEQARAGGGGGGMGGAVPPPTASEACWFCLGSSAADLGLVACVGEEAYIALDKGAITPTHALVVPIDHARCAAELSPGAFAEVERYLSALSSCFATQGLQLIAFERYLSLRKSSAGGNHCHINVMGVPSTSAGRAQKMFSDALRAAGLGEFEVLQGGAGAGATAIQCMLRGALGTGGGGAAPEYFQAILPGGLRLVQVLARGVRFPLNLGREVLAGLAGTPERADWKMCIGEGTAEKQAAAVEAFKTMFQPYAPNTAT
ncbi:hypothetical protein CEUSTIGMA_g5255.t1 [Chlamydomonas eustigma]|uniref:RRM domain-containing protein n=1 Tax=Chlamydomonas eustigma TaxID=1157962 RepID=A0A250X4J2_9CHLO|nr:hypothetical protein CEUSTIGMA_g5255.t1 [Chlamydomonas eustigma]|eukprot:GAX77812.1 hypothetical protein CEUSTIGMA_g5255.t1 [Chlamydomonas eustigma]